MTVVQDVNVIVVDDEIEMSCVHDGNTELTHEVTVFCWYVVGVRDECILLGVGSVGLGSGLGFPSPPDPQSIRHVAGYSISMFFSYIFV